VNGIATTVDSSGSSAFNPAKISHKDSKPQRFTGKKMTTRRFTLEINMGQMPLRVEIGKNNQKAPALPLVIRLL
jgi:hypothetical protein